MENKSRICFVCNTVLSYGGVQRVLAVIATALSETHDVTILTLEDSPDADHTLYGLDQTRIQIQPFRFPPLSSIENIPHKTFSALYKNLLPHTRLTSDGYARSSFPRTRRKELIQTLNAGSYDIIIGVHAFLSIKLATIRKALHARKVIGWMHNSYQAFFENEPAYLSGLQSHFKHQMQKLDGIVVLSRSDARLYLERLNLQAKVIYNPLTLKPGKPCNPAAKKFLSIGRMSPKHKGFDILIEAFARFSQNNPEWTLDIVGEGPERASLQQQIETRHLRDRIRLHPFTSDVQAYYSSASAYILSSRWEGFGLVLIEAMSHHLPIICSHLEVTEELLGDHPSAFFFENQDVDGLAQQMNRVSSLDAESLHQLGHEAALYAQEFSISSILSQWSYMID